MHLYNDNSNIPPEGEAVYVVCSKPNYFEWLVENYEGAAFIEHYEYTLVNDLVDLYLRERYKGNDNLIELYQHLTKNISIILSDEIDNTVCNLFDEAALATDMHAELGEVMLGFFRHDSTLIADTINSMLVALHEVIYFPVMYMVTICNNAGLTLHACSYEKQLDALFIQMEISQNEYSYSRYDSDDYTHVPFRLGTRPVKSIREIEISNYWCYNHSVHPGTYQYSYTQ